LPQKTLLNTVGLCTAEHLAGQELKRFFYSS